MNKLIDEKIKVMALIGRNGEGKTYRLKKILREKPNSSIYVSEEGIVEILYYKNKINLNLDDNIYVYIDEKNRSNRVDPEIQSINIGALKVIKFCKNIEKELNQIKDKSHGQRKLLNMMRIFLNYNLNSIKFILIDEPENYLDEVFLKVMADFIKLLAKEGYVVRIATHNSRLLSLLRLPLDDIIVLNNRRTYNLTFENIQYLFKESADQIESSRVKNKYDIDSGINYKLGIVEKPLVFENYIESNIKNIEFYRCLFYKEIIIVEGYSDKTALNSVKDLFNNTVIVYSPNGKAWILFYTKVFQKLGKEVTVIIDVDSNKLGHATAITEVLEMLPNIKLVKHDPDMEGYYNIDIDDTKEMIGMSRSVGNANKGWVKDIAAYIHFKDPENREVLIRNIFEKENEKYLLK